MDDPTGTDAAALERILAKLESIEARLDRLEDAISPVRELPGGVAAAVDTVDSWIDGWAHRGVDVDERMRAAAEVLERVTDPAALASLRQAVDLAQSLPGGLAAAADTVDGVIGRLQSAGIDIDQRLCIVLHVAERLTAPEALSVVRDLLDNTDVVRGLLDSGAFDPEAVEVIGRMARAFAQIDLGAVQPTGMFGAMRSLFDRRVQRAIGLLVQFGKKLGRELDHPHEK